MRAKAGWMGAAARAAAALTLAAALAGCAQEMVDAGPATSVAVAPAPPVGRDRADPTPLRPDWRLLFDDMSKGAVLINISQRWLIYWEPGARKSHAFPIAVPLNDELTRTGRTKVVRRRERPDWRATPEMIARNPDVPRYIPPGPQNPLGLYALYLGWRYYAIHGTNTPGVIGERATSGCFRLYNDDVAWLFEHVPNGAPVLVVEDVDLEPALPSEIGQGAAEASAARETPPRSARAPG